MYIKGADLRRMRLDAGLTTSETAAIAGVSTRKTYENWERNVGSPRLNQFIDLCLGCGASPADFVRQAMNREDPRTPLNIITHKENR
jgi:transcriptional regulator with XRE-family HTH domain